MSIVRALLTILAFLLNAGEAGAHASLVSTAPPDGALLAAAPQEVVLRFDEAVSPLVFRLVDDTGANVPLPATARAEGALVRVPLPPRMRDGTYLFSYRVTSADSHPVGGSIALSIGSASSSVRAEGTTTADAGGLLVAVRAARDGALLIAAGCALFLLLVAPFPGERWVLLVAGNSAAAFSALGVGLQGAAPHRNRRPSGSAAMACRRAHDLRVERDCWCDWIPGHSVWRHGATWSTTQYFSCDRSTLCDS